MLCIELHHCPSIATNSEIVAVHFRNHRLLGHHVGPSLVGRFSRQLLWFAGSSRSEQPASALPYVSDKTKRLILLGNAFRPRYVCLPTLHSLGPLRYGAGTGTELRSIPSAKHDRLDRAQRARRDRCLVQGRVIVLAFNVEPPFGIGTRWLQGGLSNCSTVSCGLPAACSFPAPCSTIWLQMANCSVFVLANVRLNASASEFTSTMASISLTASVQSLAEGSYPFQLHLRQTAMSGATDRWTVSSRLLPWPMRTSRM